jgi:hypothetical protein
MVKAGISIAMKSCIYIGDQQMKNVLETYEGILGRSMKEASDD